MNFNYLKYVLPMRRRFQAMGRTVRNRPRINRRWPQLAGMDNASREYHRRYNQLRKQNEHPT